MTRRKPASAKKRAEPAKFEQENQKKPSRLKPKTLAILVLLFAAGVVAYFSHGRISSKVSIGQFKGYNVLLITLDTVRADHLPLYGYEAIQTPHLNKLGEESFVFTDTIAHAPLTLPSHTSILTGLLPITHGVRDNGGYFLDPEETTLAEILKNHGYTTSAFVSAFVLDSRWGLNQGFDVYYDYFDISKMEDINPRYIQRKGAETEAEFEKWLQENKNKLFFSWVHFYDPHDPYDPPEPYKRIYASHLYDGEIAYTDENVGKLLYALQTNGLLEKTVIVLTADHGEGLGEHHESTHAMFIYNTTQHVPLLIRVPGGKRQTIKGITSHIDIMPTILQLVGIEPLRQMQGKSLIPLMNHREQSNRIAYSESLYAQLHYGWSPLQSITSEQYKFIHAPEPELYDRIHDPKESNNLVAAKSSVYHTMSAEFERLLSSSQQKSLKEPQRLDAETEEKLAALGYIGSAPVSSPESLKTDPKKKTHLIEGVSKAYTAVRTKEFARAISLIQPVLQEDPNIIDAHFVAGVAWMGLKQYNQAADELLKVAALKPDYTMALYKLAEVNELQGNWKEAEAWCQAILKYEKKHRPATLKLAAIYQRTGQMQKATSYYDEAAQYYEESLRTTKGENARSELYVAIADIYFRAGELKRAEEDYRKAIQLTPEKKSVHYNLGLILEAKGDVSGAVAEYQKEIELDRSNFKAFNNLGILYRQLNRLDEAVLCFQKVVDLFPSDPRGYMLLASTYKKLGKDQEAANTLRKAEQRGVKVGAHGVRP